MKQGNYWPYNLNDKPISKTYEEKAKQEEIVKEVKSIEVEETPIQPKMDSNEEIRNVISMINDIPDLPKANLVKNDDDDLDWNEDWDDAIDNIN